MSIKPMPGISPVFVTGIQSESMAPLPGVRRLTDGEDFSAMLHDLVTAGHDRFRGMTERDAAPAMLAFLRGAVASYGWRGVWLRLDGALVPVADSSEPLLPLDVFCRDGTMHVGAPYAIAEIRRAALGIRPVGFDILARLMADNGATLAFTPMEDGPGYSARVAFPGGGTAHTDGSRGDLLAAVIEAVECHVGAEAPEGEGQ